LELTERALLSRPAEVMQLIRWARDGGWGIALDDVGAHPDSLALLPFIGPDVIKLDLALVQQLPSRSQATMMAAVLAHAERTGAAILAEGIETERHLEQALAFGARYGQGWMLGKPGPLDLGVAPQPIPFAFTPRDLALSPFDVIQRIPIVRAKIKIARKSLLLAMSHHIEHQALALDIPPVVLSAFQTAERFTPHTIKRYTVLAERCPFVGALAVGLPAEPAPRVRATSLDPGDRLAGEWTVVIAGAHYGGALIARDLGDDGPDADRRFEFVLTHDRDLVLAAGRSLMRRIAAS
jgi:hypothetical protein